MAPVKKEKTPKQSVSLEAPVFDLTGKRTGVQELNPSLFGLNENPQLIAHYTYVYLQNQRQGTASTLTRAEVNATTKKVYRQKGTGGARHGSKRAPIYVGGGVAGGPKPRDYSRTLNKQQKRLALKVALSAKCKSNSICILEGEYDTMKPSTRTFTSFFKQAAINDKSTLIVLDNVSRNALVLSVRNIQGVDITSSRTLNAYDVLSHGVVIFAQNGFEETVKHILN